MENSSVHESHLTEISKQGKTLTSIKFQVDIELKNFHREKHLWSSQCNGLGESPRIHGHGLFPQRDFRSIFRGHISFSAFKGWEGGAPSTIFPLWELQPYGQASKLSYFQLPRGEREQGA